MPLGYGLQPYGLSAYGGASDTFLVTAYPVGPRVVRVELGGPPRDLSAWRIGDVRCPLTWTLTETTPTARYPAGRPIQVLGVAEVQPPLVWDLYLLESLGPPSNRHRLRSDMLVNLAGALLVSPKWRDFNGCRVSNQTDKPQQRLIVVDVANGHLFGQGRAWQATTAGTYRVEAGPASLRKRIYRILTTKPGEWVHDPTFGVGIQPKELVPGGDLPALQTRIIEQVGRDPEVVGVACQLELTSQQVLYVTLRVRGKFFEGEQLLQYRADQPGGLVEIGTGV